jgi:hypothetical protein
LRMKKIWREERTRYTRWRHNYGIKDAAAATHSVCVVILYFNASWMPTVYELLVFLDNAQYWVWEIDNGGKLDAKVWSFKTVLSNK